MLPCCPTRGDLPFDFAPWPIKLRDEGRPYDTTPMNMDIYRRVLAGESLTAILSPRAIWRLTGPDRERYLNGQVTNDVSLLRPGQACYAAVCTAKGRMEGDLFICVQGQEFYMDADAVLRESLGARLEKYLIADDAVFEDASDFWSLSHVFGPTPPPAPDTAFVVSNARYGLPGYDVWCPGSGSVVIGDHVPADVLEVLRIENGIPAWGKELTPSTLPPEAGPRMREAISYTKGCYVGQETIARLKSVGHVNRTLVFLQSDSPAFPAEGARIMLGDRETGIVTSSGFSPRLESGAALGYVQLQAAIDNTSLTAGDIRLTVRPFLASGEKS
jgi:tRNA-modifying protein YgfZ